MKEAAGYILYCDADLERKFLLLRNARHGTWAFPKGHLEPGEEARAGARREVLEETGISQLWESPEFEQCITYQVEGPRGARELKRVRYFLASVDDPRWTRSQEHDLGSWMTAAEVLDHLQHEDLRELFQTAQEHLDRHPPSR